MCKLCAMTQSWRGDGLVTLKQCVLVYISAKWEYDLLKNEAASQWKVLLRLTQVIQKMVNSIYSKEIGLQQILNYLHMSPVIWVKKIVISQKFISNSYKFRISILIPNLLRINLNNEPICINLQMDLTKHNTHSFGTRHARFKACIASTTDVSHIYAWSIIASLWEVVQVCD